MRYTDEEIKRAAQILNGQALRGNAEDSVRQCLEALDSAADAVPGDDVGEAIMRVKVRMHQADAVPAEPKGRACMNCMALGGPFPGYELSSPSECEFCDRESITSPEADAVPETSHGTTPHDGQTEAVT